MVFRLSLPSQPKNMYKAINRIGFIVCKKKNAPLRSILYIPDKLPIDIKNTEKMHTPRFKYKIEGIFVPFNALIIPSVISNMPPRAFEMQVSSIIYSGSGKYPIITVIIIKRPIIIFKTPIYLFIADTFPPDLLFIYMTPIFVMQNQGGYF